MTKDEMIEYVKSHQGVNAINSHITPLKTKECNHVYKKYVGFKEIYEYCLICDNKKENKNG